MAEVAQPNVMEDNRILYMNGIMGESTVKDIVTGLLKYESKNPMKDIILYIDSPGGSLHSFFAIHDAIKMVRCDVATVCIGKSFSAANLLLSSGTKGKRFMTVNSRTLIHELSSTASGKMSDLDNDIEECRRLQKMAEDLVFKYTNIKKKDLRRMMERDTYISSEEALEYGIVDHIIKSSRTLYSNVNT